jgi:DnaJ-class molecular chaperone
MLKITKTIKSGLSHFVMHTSIFGECGACNGHGILVRDKRDHKTKKLKVSVKTCPWCCGTGHLEYGDYRPMPERLRAVK